MDVLRINKGNYYDRLLSLTVSNALGISFYSEKWPSGVEKKIRTVRDLELLPLVTRDEFRTHVEREFPQSGNVKLIYHTSGTASGNLLYRYRLQEELEFLVAFFQKEQEKHKKDSHVVSDPIVLAEQDSFHGNQIPLPSDSLVIHASLDPTGIKHALDVLEKEFAVVGQQSRVSIIVGTCAFVMAITLALIQEGISPKEIGVKSLHIQGGFSPTNAESFLQDMWRVPITDHFSISEIFGSAPRCLACGAYSYTPTVISEFLDPISKKTVKEGLAVLVLTELYPFVSYHPLIRYWTDDLVWVEPSKCFCGEGTFIPKGRLDCALRDSKTQPERILLTPFEFAEALEETPEVAFTDEPGYSWISEMFGTVLKGFPRANLDFADSGQKKLIVLNFECIFSPLIYSAEAKRVEETLRNRLLEKSQLLQSDISEGRYELNVKACSKIENPMLLYL